MLCRVGIGKSRDGHAVVINSHDTRTRAERDVEALGRRYLRDRANIRDGRPVAVAEDPARRMFGWQRLNRLQAGIEPMLDPNAAGRAFARRVPIGGAGGASREIN